MIVVRQRETKIPRLVPTSKKVEAVTRKLLILSFPSRPSHWFIVATYEPHFLVPSPTASSVNIPARSRRIRKRRRLSVARVSFRVFGRELETERGRGWGGGGFASRRVLARRGPRETTAPRSCHHTYAHKGIKIKSKLKRKQESRSLNLNWTRGACVAVTDAFGWRFKKKNRNNNKKNNFLFLTFKNVFNK